MFCEHYFLPQVKNIGSIKIYFHTFPFQGCFVFHILMLFLKGFLVLSDLLKPVFEKVAKKILNKSQKNNQIISAYHTEVFAKKMTMNKRSTAHGLILLIMLISFSVNGCSRIQDEFLFFKLLEVFILDFGFFDQFFVLYCSKKILNSSAIFLLLI